MNNPRIADQPVHLGLGARATVQPPFTGMDWYEAYGARTASDGAEGRLVSFHEFTESWASWEMHPEGDEVVICLSGAMTIHQEMADGTTAVMTISDGEYVINPSGCWHTADVEGTASALFITAGAGTQARPR